MTIEQTNKIDVIAINKMNGKVTLGITDHLIWENSEVHLKTLQEKLNTYLHFVESGQIYTAYPDAKDRSIEITHYTKYPINDTGKAFINQANNFIKDIGITITTIQYDPESMDSV